MTKKSPYGVRRSNYLNPPTGKRLSFEESLSHAVETAKGYISYDNEEEWLRKTKEIEDFQDEMLDGKIRDEVEYEEVLALINRGTVELNELTTICPERVDIVDKPPRSFSYQSEKSLGSRIDKERVFVPDSAARILRCTNLAITKHLKRLNQEGLVSTLRVSLVKHTDIQATDDSRNRITWLPKAFWMLKNNP
jgi:hypothetical protein